MRDEFQLGKYEFFPYHDEREKTLKELEQSEITSEETEKCLEDMLAEIQKRKEKAKKD